MNISSFVLPVMLVLTSAGVVWFEMLSMISGPSLTFSVMSGIRLRLGKSIATGAVSFGSVVFTVTVSFG